MVGKRWDVETFRTTVGQEFSGTTERRPEAMAGDEAE
jgi:hypothetical protein